MKSPILSAASLALCLAMSPLAGVTLVQTYQELDGKSPAVSNTIHLDKDRVRINTGADSNQYFIYRGDKKTFLTVNLADKSYMEITEKEFQEMFAKMDEAMKKMKENLEKMPPEQRKMMEGMMAKMMPGGVADAPKTHYKKVGAGGKINGWDTDKYEGAREGAKHSEIWTAPPKELNLADADFQVLKDMARFFEKFAKNLEGMLGDKSNGLEGMPVKTITYKGGKAGFRSELKEAKKENLAPGLFEVPAGLTRKQMAKPQ